MPDLPNKIKKEFDSIVAFLAREIAFLHASRATPALVENIEVLAYGQKMPLKQLASLSVSDARTLLVQPWDSGTLQEIQKAILNSNLGMGVSVEEKYIRLSLPQLSEERRKETIKVLGKKVEEARISMRRVRDREIKLLEEAERKKEISEDQKFREKNIIQELVDEYNAKILELEKKKTEEIVGMM